jgi:DNA-binding CsgD family transcriptional regulator
MNASIKLSKKEKQLLVYSKYREGTSPEQLARKYGISRKTVYNWINLVQSQNQTNIKKLENEVIQKDMNLIDEAWDLMQQLRGPFEQCLSSGSVVPMVRIAGVMTRLIDTLAKLTGQTPPPQTNVQVNVSIMNEIRKLLNLERCPHCGGELE